ncbi:hypothetical protein CW745_06335 [Psychromonas sp. psych-6C06]|uniref:bifunctional diguanylate cyclase/phosphodiesterase n=1 Tax=Psychromonas sp. psych-6C06 TaxID=2058089 RepID=UPI000C3248B2|nr:EAL domain-containing protein [Psychromonas sp. psych-6C06]PKF63039.1 hypothetical protein CW745_06335 [Psychromonas sp. psych-6C06]
MTLSHKKTSLFFYIIALGGFLILLISGYLKFTELEYKLQAEQRYVTKLFESHVSSALFQFESMLDLISYESTLQHNLNVEVIDNILSRTPLLIGFALFNPDGEVRSISSSLQNVRLPNLLTDEKTKKWFKHALTQDQMTIGNPYILQPLNKWVVPIRKRVVDKQGNVVAVITSGLDLQTLSQQWNDGSDGRRVFQATLDNDYYRILRTNVALNKYESTYSSPISSDVIRLIEEQLAEQKISLQSLRDSGQSVQLKPSSQQSEYFTILYNPKHQIWINASESSFSLQKKLIPPLLAYSTFYLLFLVASFFIFRWVARLEKSKLAELTYRAERDLLTGLYNRTILKSKKLKFHRSNIPFSLLYIDLDNFKTINDSYGYSYGDGILIEVSKRLTSSLERVEGTAIRLSADEFIVLIASIDKDIVEEFCRELLSCINTPYIVNNNDFKISASIGIAQSPNNATEIETLISYANNSMLIAKKSKNNFIFFSEQIHRQLIKNIEIEQALKSAVDKNEISLVYQPQMNNKGELCGVEALVRWNNEGLGFIPPDQFIPIAEETGIMPALGAYIMNQAMLEISALQYKKRKSFQLSINVSARQFVQLNFFESLINCLALHKSPYMKITIEITESLFIENIERLLPIFKKMKEENISLSLDDFGTGYSSLSMLRNVPIDELKIDKSFVDDIAHDKNDRAMVASIITMGKNLGMSVLAEGVENKQQLAILQTAGCDIYQGYYFSKPLNLIDLESLIDTL